MDGELEPRLYGANRCWPRWPVTLVGVDVANRLAGVGGVWWTDDGGGAEAEAAAAAAAAAAMADDRFWDKFW